MTVVAMKQRPAAGTFDEFWLHFPAPRRGQKALCRAKWNAITNGGLKTRTLDKDSGQYVAIELQATPEEIIEGAKRYDAAMRDASGTFGKYKDDGKFCVSPAVWLNQGRWED